MLEDLIKQLIAALNANTAALTGAAPAADAPKKARGKAVDKPTDPAPAASTEAPPTEDPAPAAPAAEVAVTKEQLVAAAEALRDAGGVETIRKIATANKVERVSAAAGTAAAAPVLKALQEALAEIKKSAI